MGKIFRDLTPKQEQVFIQKRRKSAFLAASKSPSRWLSTAGRHKRAADILYEIAHAAHEREMARMQKELERTKAEMNKQGLASWSESRTLEGAELSDYLDSELLSEYLLLAGYALECILKGCLLAMKPELVENDIKLAKTVTTHNLEKLCEDCGIPLSSLERQLLEIIRLQLKWRRYPTPIDMKYMPSPVEPNPTPLDIPGSPFNKRRVRTLVDELYQRGYDLLERQRKKNLQMGV